MVDDFLELSPTSLPPELFDRSAIADVLRQHRQGEADYSQVLWSLLNYAAWSDLYLHRKAN
jgi:hypothetical protein